MDRRCFAWITAVVCAWSLLAIAGCVSAKTRYISSPGAPPPELNLRGASKEIEAKLHYVILPNGPGSWVKGANWSEWVVSITNLTQSDVTVQKISLIDSRGVYVGAGYVTAHQLSSPSEIGKVGTGDVISSMVNPFWGFSYVGAMQDEFKDLEVISAEIARRQLPVPLEMAGNASLRGSVFFPVVPQARALVITYQFIGGQTQLKVPLE